LKLKYDELLSNFAFNCKLRHYMLVAGQTRKLVSSGAGTGAGQGYATSCNRL